jgi:hypothetical protein
MENTKPEMVQTRKGPRLVGTISEAIVYLVRKHGPLQAGDLEDLVPAEFPGLPRPTFGWAGSLLYCVRSNRLKRIARGLFDLA